jgi:hypothetical protein
MTNTGQSKRSRAYQRQLDDEYQRVWGHRLPQDEKQQPYKKFGLPLVLAPFALMFCGGCVGSVPAASMLIALFFSVMWLGERVGTLTKTAPYWVIYQKTPAWQLGESSDTVWARRKELKSIEDAQRYQNDYVGRIISVVDGKQSKPGWACSDTEDCLLMDLTPAQRSDAASHKLKISGAALASISIEDEYGAVAAALSAYSKEDLADAKIVSDLDTDPIIAKRRETISRIIVSASDDLPRTDAHTGTGLYRVKPSPTHNDDTQSGAPSGQVITLTTGGLGTADFWKGGYIVNATRTETRSIVSHTDTTVTLEGALTNWVNTDDLDIYDSWNTVSGAVSQLYTDQGATDTSSSQTIELFNSTYNESVIFTALSGVTLKNPLFIKAASGQTAVTVTNVTLTSESFRLNETPSIIFEDFTIESRYTGGYAISTSRPGTHLYNMVIAGSGNTGHGFTGSLLYAYRSTFSDLNRATLQCDGLWSECTFYDCTWCAYADGGRQGRTFSCCVFNNNARCIYVATPKANAPIPFHCTTIVNCTFYSNDSAIYSRPSLDYRTTTYRMINCIFHSDTLVLEANETATTLHRIDSDYNTFYSVTNIANIAGTTYNLAGWQALTDTRGFSPDAHSVTTDPGITTPGSDWSLTAGSKCRHAGVGSFAICPEGINQVAFDKWHPDKGAWSSGPGANVAYIG